MLLRPYNRKMEATQVNSLQKFAFSHEKYTRLVSWRSSFISVTRVLAEGHNFKHFKYE